MDQILIRCNLMMMLPAFQFACFAVFIASFSCVKAEVLSQSQYNGINPLKDDNGFSNHTGCVCSCSVVISDFLEGRKTAFVKGILIKLHIKYDIMVDEKCLKRTSLSSSGNAIGCFEVWQPEDTDKIFAFEQAMQVSTNILFFPDSELYIDVKAVCSLCPFGTRSVAADSTPHDFLLQLQSTVLSYLADHGLGLTINKMDGWVHFSIIFWGGGIPAGFLIVLPCLYLSVFSHSLKGKWPSTANCVRGIEPGQFGKFCGKLFPFWVGHHLA